MANVLVAAKWQLLGDRYYRKPEVYHPMQWRHIDLSRNKVAYAPFGDSVALIPDDSKIVQLYSDPPSESSASSTLLLKAAELFSKSCHRLLFTHQASKANSGRDLHCRLVKKKNILHCLTQIETLDASLAKELSAMRKKMERLRSNRERMEKMLREWDLMLEMKMKEVEERGEIQKSLEIELDRLYRLKQLQSQSVNLEKNMKNSMILICGRFDVAGIDDL